MSHQIETFPVGDRFRVAVHADVDAENPRTLGDPATEAFTYRSDFRTIDVEAGRDDHLNVSFAYERLDQYAITGLTSDHVIRWAWIFYSVTVINDGRTLWWVDPAWMAENYPDVKRGTPEYVTLEQDVIAGEQREYQMWAEGNVYGITIEKLTTWAKLFDDGTADLLSRRNEWEDVDSLWGIYFDDGYPTRDEVLKQALEMDVDDEFREAFSALNETSQEATA